MLGFLGTFFVNFEIPDYWGIGKSVPRGLGTVKKIKNIDSINRICHSSYKCSYMEVYNEIC